MQSHAADSRSEYVLYARIWPRMKALLIDGAILAGAFFLAALVGSHLEGTGAAAFCLWVAFWALYDPLMVWLTGGTVGHHLFNLRVVSDRTGKNPNFLAAFLRNIVKGVIGTISLLAMAGSSRKKAFHDWVIGTTVQARDARLAPLRAFSRVRREAKPTTPARAQA